ncbi:MAG: Flp pilus assembly complex ATPase component TadA [Planctomycetes bacterium]|jgi:type II secretory ATPase GspE/PulE/Tfp pilus assembly ATPase PilB-like protein|nr:Flp pilus assembly complex ATPase component TadA [Planctomycetota bacterium]
MTHKILQKILPFLKQQGLSRLLIHPEEENKTLRCRSKNNEELALNLDPTSTKQLAIFLHNLTKLEEKGEIINSYHKIDCGEKNFPFFLSIFPSEQGKKIIIELVDKKINALSLNNLGLNQEQQKLINQSLKRGLVIIGSPDNSGKSTTYYSLLNILKKHELNINTLEKHRECHLTGINQLKLLEKKDFSFKKGLETLLRHDCEVIGIDDLTEKDLFLVAPAIQTGRLVINTLRTNSILQTIAKLLTNNFSAHNLGTNLSLIINQILVRKNCPHCLKKRDLHSEEKKEIEHLLKKSIWCQNTYYSTGCLHCQQSGFLGQVSLFEVLAPSQELRSLLLNNNNVTKDSLLEKISEQLKKEEFPFLQDDALLKLQLGSISLTEFFKLLDLNL